MAHSAGRPYLSLEFIDGESLAHLLQGTPQPVLPAARLVETLARTIHYAHQRNIVHRDLKPANILMQHEEGRPRDREASFLLTASFHPRITDFGLAKRLDVQASGSASGEVVGTPSYMAPEQAAGRRERSARPLTFTPSAPSCTNC